MGVFLAACINQVDWVAFGQSSSAFWMSTCNIITNTNISLFIHIVSFNKLFIMWRNWGFKKKRKIQKIIGVEVYSLCTCQILILLVSGQTPHEQPQLLRWGSNALEVSCNVETRARSQADLFFVLLKNISTTSHCSMSSSVSGPWGLVVVWKRAEQSVGTVFTFFPSVDDVRYEQRWCGLLPFTAAFQTRLHTGIVSVRSVCVCVCDPCS